jgi:hypothetical protein
MVVVLLQDIGSKAKGTIINLESSHASRLIKNGMAELPNQKPIVETASVEVEEKPKRKRKPKTQE